MVKENEYSPEQYQEVFRRLVVEMGLQDYWTLLWFIAQEESGWRGVQSMYPDPDGPDGREDSWGPFQLNREGVGSGYTAEELLEPETQISLALQHFASKIALGQSLQEATSAWSVTHRYSEEQLQGIADSPSILTYTPDPATWTPSTTTTPAVTGTGLTQPDATNPKYYFTEEQVGPGGLYEGMGVAGGFNYQLFQTDYASWWDVTHPPETEGTEDLGLYFQAIIQQRANQIAAGQLEVSQATVELGKRLDALSQGRQLYTDLLPQALPPGTEHIPGGAPGGLYEKLGLGVMPASTTQINPFAVALALMGQTPEMGAVPDTSFELALAQAQQLMAAAGATPTPETVLAAGAPQPSLAEAAANVPSGAGLYTPVPTTAEAAASLPPAGYTPIPTVTEPPATGGGAQDILSIMAALGGDIGILDILRLIQQFGGGTPQTPLPAGEGTTPDQILARGMA